tara:strand:- start:17207 stop:18310 length:1104 start_codon:yes stop_codon:yes gene_type:complete
MKTQAKKLELKRAIFELEMPYPKDDLILNYADFLKSRDFLQYYQFNPIVFERLLNLVVNEWNSEKRMNRLSLLQVVKKYFNVSLMETSNKRYYQSNRLNYLFSIETRKLLFEIFRKVFVEGNYISQKQLGEAEKIVNNLLINIDLTPIEEKWFCSMAEKSELILNRLLRYPTKSKIISQWARDNYTISLIRNRRPEIVGWLLDEDSNFEVDNQILIDDFEAINAFDIEAIKSYEDELAMNTLLINEFGGFKQKSDNTSNILIDGSIKGPDSIELKLTKRYYRVPTDSTKNLPVSIPDFDQLHQVFYSNIITTQKLTMIWAIAYSRLEISVKIELLKKYYCDETYHTLVKIGKRLENKEFLSWMLSVQ